MLCSVNSITSGQFEVPHMTWWFIISCITNLTQAVTSRHKRTSDPTTQKSSSFRNRKGVEARCWNFRWIAKIDTLHSIAISRPRFSTVEQRRLVTDGRSACQHWHHGCWPTFHSIFFFAFFAFFLLNLVSTATTQLRSSFQQTVNINCYGEWPKRTSFFLQRLGVTNDSKCKSAAVMEISFEQIIFFCVHKLLSSTAHCFKIIIFFLCRRRPFKHSPLKTSFIVHWRLWLATCNSTAFR